MKFPCPLCGREKVVRINRRSKPYLRCDDCGVLMFVNRRSGMRIIQAGEMPTEGKKSSQTAASYFDLRR